MKLVQTMLIAILILLPSYADAQAPIYSAEALHHPIIGQNGMVSSQHPEATRVGVEILKQGGNAVDAAVAVGFSLAVVLPRAGNIGGGGFMVVHSADKEETKVVNYREKAPAKGHRDMFIGADNEVDRVLATTSFQASGVPGTVAGLVLALERYGTMSLTDVIAPAIRLAEEGFTVTHDLAYVLGALESRMRRWPETEKIFYKGKDQRFRAGDILKQPELAWSLKQIAQDGKDAFYKGPIAERIAKDMAENNGLITKEDLAAYEALLVDPVWGTYRGYQVASAPPPSSGGIHIIQMLNILEGYPIGYLKHNSAETIHLMTEAMKLAYADRSEHLGDPLFWDVPLKGLASKSYAETLRNRINPRRTTPSSDISHGAPQDYESTETTHFVVMDARGNTVSNTYTLNFSFGSGIVAKGTGILLNNEMDDFSAKPGSPNAFGLIGGDANAIEPGKRPLSSMSPTIVFKDGQPFLATGTPGGSRIITTTLQVIMNVIDHNMNVAEATHASRIHHQWYPDQLFIERGVSSDTIDLLFEKGHTVVVRNAMGSTQSIMRNGDTLLGSADPRRPDARAAGY